MSDFRYDAVMLPGSMPGGQPLLEGGNRQAETPAAGPDNKGMDKNTYIVRYDTEKYKYTNAVQVPNRGLFRRDEIEKVVGWVRANVPGVIRVTSVTGPVTTWQAD